MFAEIRGLNEECGVFGIWGHPSASSLTYFGLHSLQHRGQEGAGIVSLTDEGRLIGHRDLGLLAQVFQREEDLLQLQGSAAVGHVRYATAGNNGVQNIQPFLFRFFDEELSLAHNGNLVNAQSLRRQLEDQGALFHSDSDTEVLLHLIRRSKQSDLVSRMSEALQQVKGGFTYVLLSKEGLIGAVDPNGFRPLVIGKMVNGAYVAASETCALDAVGAAFVYDVKPGELVVINDSGMTVHAYTKQTQCAVCAMEYIYFARPDSNIRGINVHKARKNMGRRLAQEAPTPEADMVIGVPNSSLSAASGYAEEAGIPYEMGLIKNQYVARTFIQPTQALREQGVRMKLSAVRSIVAGKRVVMVDDSIVRGTTSKRIVRLLKEAGAVEVHVRIASPPLKYPCFYGIDISNTRELIAATHTLDEIQELIGADSLAYLSEEGLIDAIGLQEDAPYGGLCMAYFNGDFPTPLHDYESDYQEQLIELSALSEQKQQNHTPQ